MTPFTNSAIIPVPSIQFETIMAIVPSLPQGVKGRGERCGINFISYLLKFLLYPLDKKGWLGGFRLPVVISDFSNSYYLNSGSIANFLILQ